MAESAGCLRLLGPHCQTAGRCAFADRTKGLPTLAFTHLQPAQPTTVGKRAALWLQDLLEDARALDSLLAELRPLGSKGTTGTQASFLALFEGDYEKVKALDLMTARKMGFDRPVALSSQTYSRAGQQGASLPVRPGPVRRQVRGGYPAACPHEGN